jgi:hypothetical protein
VYLLISIWQSDCTKYKNKNCFQLTNILNKLWRCWLAFHKEWVSLFKRISWLYGVEFERIIKSVSGVSFRTGWLTWQTPQKEESLEIWIFAVYYAGIDCTQLIAGLERVVLALSNKID